MGRLTSCNPQEPPQNHVNVCGFWRLAEAPHVGLTFPHGKKSFVSHPRLVTTALVRRSVLFAPDGDRNPASLTKSIVYLISCARRYAKGLSQIYVYRRHAGIPSHGLQLRTGLLDNEPVFLLYFASVRWVTGTICVTTPPPRRRDRHVIEDRVCRARATRGRKHGPKFDAPPGLTWRGDAPRDARPRAPAASAAASTRRVTVAVAALRGGGHATPLPSRWRSVPPPAWTCLCWEGGRALAFGAHPPLPLYLSMGSAAGRTLPDRPRRRPLPRLWGRQRPSLLARRPQTHRDAASTAAEGLGE